MKAKKIVKNVLRKIINPKTLFTLIKIKREKKNKKNRVYIDSYLKTYSKMFRSESLHFPYFSKPDIDPEEISLSDIENGGIEYSKLIIKKIVDKATPVLDVGCGLGGLCKMLLTGGYKPVGLTPDNYQYNYITEKYPEIKVIQSKLETMDSTSFRHAFGTIITAESLQYLKLDKAFPIIDDILKPSGHWIVCDYFKTVTKFSLKHQHHWDDFVNRIHKMKWEIVSQQDITKNVLPFLAYCSTFSKKILLPMLGFFIDQFHNKKPGAYFLLEDTIDSINADIIKRLRYIDPDVFSQERKYMLLVIKKK
jgi:cyclopropane fatty-acyl-phospholipid synthase-like methyltransferase